ncbi:AMP-binding protein [Azospirillum oleiclasticum]
MRHRQGTVTMDRIETLCPPCSDASDSIADPGGITGHVDRFTVDRLPEPAQWPDLRCVGGGLTYPARLNVASELIDRWVGQGHGDRDCLIGAGGIWSYARVAATVDRIARVLTEDCGLVPGNRVLLRGPNTPMLVACWLAVVKAGGVAVATMPLLRAAELAQIIDRAQVDVALCDERFANDLLAGAPAELPVLTFNGTAPDRLEARIARKPDGFTAADTAATDVAVIAFTSGTTGRPKATAHFHRDLLSVADLSPRAILRTRPDDVFCGTPSIAFAYGLGGLLLFPLRVGASVVLLERTTPECLLDGIRRHRATLLFTVPTAYRALTALIEEQGSTGDALPSLRLCVSAGEPLPASTFEAWKAATGCIILDSLGTTELLNAVIHADPADLRPGATGKPVPGYEAMVVDDQFNPVPPGQVGRLAVRGPTGCRYLDDPRQANYVQRGWNLTGDAFHVDGDGFFWYHARTDDLIVSGGYKISGLEVEDVLLHHDLVEECAVIASPDPLRGTVPKAFVVVRDGVALTNDLARDLQDYVKTRIAPYKYPRAVEFLEQLPRTETGKVQRYKLREMERRGGDADGE